MPKAVSIRSCQVRERYLLQLPVKKFINKRAKRSESLPLGRRTAMITPETVMKSLFCSQIQQCLKWQIMMQRLKKNNIHNRAF
jgi:hypothetical protein